VSQAFPASQWYAVTLIIARIVFGTFWLIDGTLFWTSAASPTSALVVYSVGPVELALGILIILGLMRKVAYGVSFFFSLLIWAVPEGFRGLYGPSSTDIGSGIVYAFASLLFLLIIGIFGPSPYSMDYQIEKRFPAWKRIAEMKRVVVLEDGKVSSGSEGESLFLVGMIVVVMAITLVAEFLVHGGLP
jgi:nitrite reductase (NO-forming)